MSEPQSGSNAGRFEVRVTAEAHFAWLRTRLAVERTMMAYMRTSVSLIGFGFAIVQFLGNIRAMPGEKAPRFPEAAWYLGLSLIFCGVLAALFAIREYRWTLRYLSEGDFAPVAHVSKEGRRSPLFGMSVLLAFIGLFAFFAVLLKFT